MTKAEQRDRAIRKAWAKMDKDGNGSLSYSELTKHLGMTEEEAGKVAFFACPAVVFVISHAAFSFSFQHAQSSF